MVDFIFQIILCVIILLFPLYMIWEMIKALLQTTKQLYTQKHLQREDMIEHLVCTDWGYAYLDAIDKNYSIENITDSRFEDERN